MIKALKRAVQDVIIPERFRGYQIFSKTCVAITLGHDAVYAAKSRFRGHRRTILKLHEEPINRQTLTHENETPEHVVAALTKLKQHLGSYDVLYTPLPSNLVIFKELTVPLHDLTKIKMILPFEIEAALPFSLDQAIVDSIITKQSDTTTTVIVAAAQRAAVEEYRAPFAHAGLPIDTISLDLFELYGFLQALPHSIIKNTTAFMALEYDYTSLGLLHNGRLVAVRILPRGLASVITAVTQALNIPSDEARKQLFRFGSTNNDNHQFAEEAKKALGTLITECQFTIATFLKKIEPPAELSSLLVTGAGTEVNHMKELLHKAMDVPVTFIEPQMILHSGTVTSNVQPLPSRYFMSIVTSLALPTTAQFNLHKEAEEAKETATTTKQIITLVLLISSILGAWSLSSFIRIRTLKTAIRTIEQEAIERLNKQFAFRRKPPNLAAANKRARTELMKGQTAWSRLSATNRYALLNTLIELAKCIKPQEIQLDLRRIWIKETMVKLYGAVPGYPQLAKLQKQLECPLFESVPKLQNYNFTSEPITLRIRSEGV